MISVDDGNLFSLDKQGLEKSLNPTSQPFIPIKKNSLPNPNKMGYDSPTKLASAYS